MAEESIGRYQITSELGRGAMGIVYKAVDPTIGRTVALKTLRMDTQGVAEEEMKRRFKHEARLAGAMNHPNIVTIYDAGDHGSIFYIAMEYMEGVTLQSILHEQHTLPVAKIVDMARHICGALDYAHQQGVIHRDIKPANIMTTPLGSVKIMDFGIAKSEAGMTSAGQVLGTPAYMSPEQIQGKELDGRSDLFSFGVMLYEMATGEMPFSGKNVTTIVYKIVNESPTPPRELDVTMHPGLSSIIMKALAKRPDERYQTGVELVHDLENYKSFLADPHATMALGGSAPTRVVQAASAGASSGMTAGMTVPMQSSGTPAATAKTRSDASVGTTAATARPRAPQRTPAPPLTKESSFGLGKIALAVVVAFVLVGGFLRYKAGNTIPKQDAAPAIAANVSAKAVANPSAASVEPAKPKALPKAIPPAPHLGELQISSTPTGAAVAIGGETQPDWVTPFTARKLAPGSYDLTFSKPNFVSQTMSVKVVAGQSLSIGADLVPSGGKLSVSSEPAGANIIVDGQPTGKVTPGEISIDAGQHRIQVRKPGFLEENTSVSLQNGETYSFNPTLTPQQRAGGSNQQPGVGVGKPANQPAGFGDGQGGGNAWMQNAFAQGKGVVVIQTNPAGATVLLNGRTWPKTTPVRGPIPPGTYHMTVTLDGYKPIQRDVTVEQGKPTFLQLPLAPQ